MKKAYYSKISDQKRFKNILTSPLLTDETQLISWVNEILPQMLWVALLISQTPRDKLFQAFSKACEHAHRIKEAAQLTANWDCTLTGLLALDETDFDTMVGDILLVPDAITALRPLLLFENIPGHNRWKKALNTTPAHDEDWETIHQAIEMNFDFQSREATDCCLAHIMFCAAAGYMQVKKSDKNMVKNLCDAADAIGKDPNAEYCPEIASMIRSTGLASAQLLKEKNQEWANSFWESCYELNPCMIPQPDDFSPTFDPKEVFSIAATIRSELARHFLKTLENTDVNPQHDAIFGLANYALQIFIECIEKNSHAKICGRIELRSIVDVLIILAYLRAKNDATLWQQYRDYGTGQAKLSFSQLNECKQANIPSYVDIDVLEQLANEDKWQEYIPINLGNWDQLNTRKMAEEAGLGDLYRIYYNWPSSYSHAHWSSVNESRFIRCSNPLHRYHRILSPFPIVLNSVVPDACKLLNKILDIVNDVYSGFSLRITFTENASAAVA